MTGSRTKGIIKKESTLRVQIMKKISILNALYFIFVVWGLTVGQVGSCWTFPCGCVGFLQVVCFLHTSTYSRCDCGCVCLSICVTLVIDWWPASNPVHAGIDSSSLQLWTRYTFSGLMEGWIFNMKTHIIYSVWRNLISPLTHTDSVATTAWIQGVV